MTKTTLLDDTTRPRAPRIEGMTTFQERRGKRLALIHRMHLQELNWVRRVMQQIEAGEKQLAELGEAVSSLKMADNYKAFGSLCGQECQLLNFHHMAEERVVFPALERQGSDGLQQVVQRLREEHEVIHALLEDLGSCAVAAIGRADAVSFAELRQAFEKLDKTVRSHFGYEEGELEQALGYYEVEL